MNSELSEMLPDSAHKDFLVFLEWFLNVNPLSLSIGDKVRHIFLYTILFKEDYKSTLRTEMGGHYHWQSVQASRS